MLPNGLALSRVAGYAGLGSVYIIRPEEHTNEDTKPKATSAAAPGWAV
jgi:hypothetical protein